jgi:hypothetical protein
VLLTFILVLLGWVIFRSASISDAYYYICGIFDNSLLSVPEINPRGLAVSTLFFTVVMFVVEWLNRDEGHGLVLRMGGLYRYMICVLLIWLILLFRSTEPVDFVYFQF